MTPSITLGQRHISANDPTYVVAEVGVNHNGDVQLAHRMIDAAKSAGADAVKFQTYRTKDLVLESALKADYQKESTGAGGQYEMLSSLELPFEDFAALRKHCREVGIDFMSTAFDPVSLEFVSKLNPICLKWPSGELTNWPLLRQARNIPLPLMLSTGMGSLQEVSAAVDLMGAQAEIVILQCVSNYPAQIEEQNLRVLPAMQAAFGVPVGFSDHTLGPYAALAARALGMSVLEKHFTLDRAMKGPDHASSIEPKEFSDMIKILRAVERGLGDGVKRRSATEDNVKAVARKSLVYRSDLECGHILCEKDLSSKRPGIGVQPDRLEMFVGRRLARNVLADTLLQIEDVR